MLSRLRKIDSTNRPTTVDFNKVVDRLNLLSNIHGGGGIGVKANPAGINIFNSNTFRGANFKIFEVQTAAAGDGVYNCYEQTLDGSDWGSTTNVDKFTDLNATGVEVFNLDENYCLAAYEEALAQYDLIQAWQMYDDDGGLRWVGIPLVGGARLAKTTEAAQNDTNITANLILRTGAEAAALGSGITAYGLANTGTADFDDSVPRWATAKELYVKNEQGKWYVVTTLQQSEDCACS